MGPCFHQNGLDEGALVRLEASDVTSASTSPTTTLTTSGVTLEEEEERKSFGRFSSSSNDDDDGGGNSKSDCFVEKWNDPFLKFKSCCFLLLKEVLKIETDKKFEDGSVEMF